MTAPFGSGVRFHRYRLARACHAIHRHARNRARAPCPTSHHAVSSAFARRRALGAEQELHATESDVGDTIESTLGHETRTANVRAVGRTEVGDEPAFLPRDELRMRVRDAVVHDYHVVMSASTDMSERYAYLVPLSLVDAFVR